MTVSAFAWILMAAWLIFGGWGVSVATPATAPNGVRVSSWGGFIVMWLLVACFVFAHFGFPIKG